MTARSPRRRRVRHSRRRRIRPGTAVALVAVPLLLLTAFLLIGGFAIAIFEASATEEPPTQPTVAALPPSAGEPQIAGYGLDQLDNACTILAAGRDLGHDDRDQTIAIMTAMGESSLRNIDYGDWETSGVTNPDGSRTTSIGLFQQQDSWGTREQRLDPYTAATLFYRALTRKVPERAELEPTIVAHLTQVNDDPQHYARYWDRAVRVVAALNGSPQEGDRTDGVPLCPA